MKRGLGVLGVAALLVVVAVVLLLAARSTREVAPVVKTLRRPADRLAAPPSETGHLPDVPEMKDATDAHAAGVQDALRDTE